MVTLISPASRSRVRVSQVVESTRGVTPNNPAFKILPHLENTALNQSQAFQRSNQVKSNRQGGKQVGGNISVGGSIAVPVKHDPAIRELIESAISGALAHPTATGATYSFASATTITRSSGSFVTDGWKVGAVIVVTGSTTNTNNVASGDNIKVTGVADTTLTIASGTFTAEAFAVGTTLTTTMWFGKSGTSRKFFTHEVSYLDLSPVVHERFLGNEVNTFNINVPTSGEVTGEFGMIGTSGAISDSGILSGATYASESGNVPFAGSVAGSKLLRGGTEAPDVESLSISMNNNRAAKFIVGQQTAGFVEEGDFDVELSMSLYFTSKAVKETYLNGTRTSLEATVVDQQDGHSMTLEFPNIVFTKNENGNNGSTVVQSCTAFVEEDVTHGAKALVYIFPTS